MNKQRIIIGSISIIGLISCILPWFSIKMGMNIPFLSQNKMFGNGMNVTMLQQGWILLLSYLATAGIVFFTNPKKEKRDKQKTKWLLIAGSVSLALTLYSMIQISNVYFMMKVSYGIGLYISIGASARILGVTYFHWKKNFGNSEILQDRDDQSEENELESDFICKSA